jgi:hypothetical protein
MVVAAFLGLVAIGLAIYVGILDKRLARATKFAHAGMTSVGYVCLVVVDILRLPDPPPEILRPADACMGQTENAAEGKERNAELNARDYKAIANRIEAFMNDNRLPIGSVNYMKTIDPKGLPKGLRDE